MKRNRHSQNQGQPSANPPQPTAAAALSQNEIDFVPSPDEVARRAYFTFVNQGSLPGRDVQHWLAAEAHLISQRNLTRVHAGHHPAHK